MRVTGNIKFIALSAALGGLLFGYDTAVISGAVGSLTQYFSLTPLQTGWAISSALVGCLIGALVSDFLSTRFGRKNSMILASLLFFLSAIGTALPETFSVFIYFRIMGGVGVGLASMVVPMYIAEIAPANKRGQLVAYNQLAVVTGMMAVYFINYFIALQGNAEWNFTTGWRYMFGSESLPALLYFLLLLFVPESPRWLMMKGEREKAATILKRNNTDNEAQALLAEMDASANKKEKSEWKLLFHPSLRLALLVGIGLSVFQQITGINAILYYAPEIFKSFGSSANASLLETSMLGVVNLVFTVLSIYFVDRVGRKPLLYAGSSGMFLSLTVVGLGAYYQVQGVWLLPFLLIFMASFSVSWGPVVWVLLSEIFPNRVRSLALAIAVFIQWAANFAVSQTFPLLTKSPFLNTIFNGAFPFGLFAVFCLLAIVFIWKYVPETKNRPLEEMDSLWDIRIK